MRIAVLIAVLAAATDSEKSSSDAVRDRSNGAYLADAQPGDAARDRSDDRTDPCGAEPRPDAAAVENHRLRLRNDRSPPHGAGDWHRDPGSADACDARTYYRHPRPPRASARSIA